MNRFLVWITAKNQLSWLAFPWFYSALPRIWWNSSLNRLWLLSTHLFIKSYHYSTHTTQYNTTQHLSLIKHHKITEEKFIQISVCALTLLLSLQKQKALLIKIYVLFKLFSGNVLTTEVIQNWTRNSRVIMNGEYKVFQLRNYPSTWPDRQTDRERERAGNQKNLLSEGHGLFLLTAMSQLILGVTQVRKIYGP